MREQIDARVSLAWPIRELGQLEVILARQMLADVADLVLHDVMIVAQPFLGTDGRLVRARRGRQKKIGGVQLLAARFELRQ